MSLTLAQLAEHVNMRGGVPTEPEKVAELQRMLDAAVQRVEVVCGPLEPRDVVERVDVVRGTGLSDAWPVLALLTSRAAPQLWEATSTPTAAVVAGLDDDGVLHCQSALTGSVLITARVGRTPVPAVLEEAVLILAAHLYETQRTVNAPSGSGDAPVLSGFAIPRRAAELMKPFASPRVG